MDADDSVSGRFLPRVVNHPLYVMQQRAPSVTMASLRGMRPESAWLVALACLLGLAACSGSPRKPVANTSLAPIPLPADEFDAGADAAPEAPKREPLSTQAEFEDPPADAPAGDFDRLTGPQLAFDPEEPATSEDEIALLDELIELTLPEAPPVLSHEEALLHTRSVLPLVMNDQVQRLINYFTKTKRGSTTMRTSLGRGHAYRPMIERILEEEGVPPELFYLAMAESGFRPKARSYMRATGMWQFMSSRGKQYGLRQDRYVDLRYDPETATRAAAKHLKDLHIEFGDWYLAMAAYNSGPNRITSAIRRTGSRDYWTLVRRRALPRETRNYVPIILAMTYVGQNLDLFELGELDLAPELQNDRVRTESEVSFALIADATRSSIETIKELNPALLRSATPPYGYQLNLPRGTEHLFRQEMAMVPPDKRLNWRRYEIRPGETLQAVAARYNVKRATLASINSLPEDGALEGGLRLTVPTTTRMSIYRYYGRGRAGGLLEPGTGRYKIARGDTLGGISRRFGVTVANLLAWNGLTSTRIRAGRYLIVRPEGIGGTTASGSAPTGRYTVRRGETLSGIGARFGASVTQLRSWNGIRGSTIHVGQTLKVPGPAPAPPPRQTAASARVPARRVPAPGPNHYRIRSGDTLSTIAARFGVSVPDLRSWNRLRSSRITAGKFLVVRPPSDSSPSASRAEARRPAPRLARPVPPPTPGNATVRYIVRRGDTLGGIAEDHNVTAAKLRAWNNIRGSRIFPGQELVVKEQPGSGAARSRGAPPVRSGTGTHRVGRGDTLDAIAKRYAVPVNDLMRWNNLRSSRIYPGQQLAVRSGASSGQEQSYRIQRGDTLASIAKRFNVTVRDLKQWNGLSSSRIRAGATLRIDPAGS